MTDKWHLTASRVRSKLAALRQGHPDDAGEIFEVILLLDGLEQLYREVTAQGSGKNAGGKKSFKPARIYRRVIESDQVYLTESRASGQPAFRVPREVYDAATQVMAEAKEPMSFAAWHRATAKAVKKDCPDYLCRVVLRFWLQVARDSLRKVGTRYEPCNPGTFKKQSAESITSFALSQ